MRGAVEVRIDGTSYSSSSPVTIRPQHRDGNRYHNWISLVTLTDTKTGAERLVVVQRLGPDIGPTQLRQMKFRLLLISPSGQVQEDVFDFADRSSPAYRTMLAQFVSPTPIGFRSNVLMVWPSCFYPIIYPFGTGAVGFGFILFATVRKFVGRKHVNVPSGG